MTEAMALIKQQLGDDALILNTKKIKTGGLFGLFQQDRLEVTAAIETAEEVAQEVKPSAGTAPVAAVKTATPVPPKNKDDIMEELQSLKRLMMHELPEDRLPKNLRPVRDQLMRQGVEEDVQTELLTRLLPKAGDTEKFTEETFHAEVVGFIEERQLAASERMPAIACFIGPTGVGKTTTIAKVAAEQLLEHKRTVGLITADTYRIAAVTQLKTYGDILEVPVEVVESREQLASALQSLNACDVILIDTAGRNYQQLQYIEELQQLLPEGQHIHTTLVLSLTAKFEDMVQIIKNFEMLPIDELLLTKKDETASAGAILNLLNRYPIPLRRIATGQNVPDDLVAATPARIADYIVGIQRHA